jgi:DnaK suppressor protein
MKGAVKSSVKGVLKAKVKAKPAVKAKKSGATPGLRIAVKASEKRVTAAPAPVAVVKNERRATRLKRFKKIFLEQRNGILYNDRIIREDFNASSDDRFDEVDQASTDMEQSMRMRLRSREMLYLKKVDEALKRIEEDSFGLCNECGEEIEVRRLEARPTATLCVGCKEEEERRESLSAFGREHKSLGESFSRKYA